MPLQASTSVEHHGPHAGRAAPFEHDLQRPQGGKGLPVEAQQTRRVLAKACLFALRRAGGRSNTATRRVD